MRSVHGLLAAVAAAALLIAGCATGDDLDAETAAAPADPVPVQATQDVDLLETVRSRGVLNCGVYGAAVAFSETQPDGSTTGFDADYCRALAIAMLGDAGSVNFVPLTSAETIHGVAERPHRRAGAEHDLDPKPRRRS